MEEMVRAGVRGRAPGQCQVGGEGPAHHGAVDSDSISFSGHRDQRQARPVRRNCRHETVGSMTQKVDRRQEVDWK